jgi:hypothetical protein
MTTMLPYDERGKYLMWRRQLALTGHGTPKVTFYFIMLSCPADLRDD